MTEQHPSITIPLSCEDKEMLPNYSSSGASGADVRAHIQQSIILKPGCSALVSTGLRFAIPHGYEIQIRPRSGLALKHSLTVLNTPGTIDADYRGVLGVILINHGKEDFEITPGMRIAQIIVTPVVQAKFELCENLEETVRGCGGFGHTGIH